MFKKQFLFSLILLISCSLASATTWDEPWQKEIMENADSFVKVLVTKSNEDEFEAEVIKHFAGIPTEMNIKVNGVYMLKIGTLNLDHPYEFNMSENSEYYLFIKGTGREGEYQISTPTSGYAKIVEGNVYATYRHSFHKALVPSEMYEKSMSELFMRIKGNNYDKEYFSDLFNIYLNQPPSTLENVEIDSEEAKLFFKQHVALESLYLLSDEYYKKYYELLLPFLNSNFFHVQISAIRAMSTFNTDDSKNQIFKFLLGEGDNFAKVIAVWALRDLDAQEYTDELKEYSKTASEEETYFESNIMDPRVGTFFPRSVKDAVEKLLEEWNK